MVSSAKTNGVYSNIKIVISWRRDCPSAGTVHRIYDRLAERYGKDAVFFDMESMREGNFPNQIGKAISHARVLLVIIGQIGLEPTAARIGLAIPRIGFEKR